MPDYLLPFGFGGFIFGVIGLSFFLHYVPLPLWLASALSGVNVSIWDLFNMRAFRNINPHEVVVPLLTAKFANVKVNLGQIQQHKIAGGNVDRVISALIAASKANIELDWNTATSIDLAGRDVLQAVQTSVNPRVIQTKLIEAVAQDGIQLQAIALVTVRTDIARLVGSAGEDTVLARVGEGIVTAIGRARDFREVLEHPDNITQAVEATGLDSGTAYEILSIDICEIDVGSNIGARLQIDQANADKQIAQARAEQRRAEAVALQQSMKAKVQEMRAKVVEAEADVPSALADALQSGAFTVGDYYKMQNLIADTRMRESLGGNTAPETTRLA
jgi:uncharacterized protein YqfA (UPF0365 family)